MSTSCPGLRGRGSKLRARKERRGPRAFLGSLSTPPCRKGVLEVALDSVGEGWHFRHLTSLRSGQQAMVNTWSASPIIRTTERTDKGPRPHRGCHWPPRCRRHPGSEWWVQAPMEYRIRSATPPASSCCPPRPPRSVLGIKTEQQADQPAFYVPRYLAAAGLDVGPFVDYPEVTEILGRPVDRRLVDVPGEIDLVDVFRRPRHPAPSGGHARRTAAGGLDAVFATTPWRAPWPRRGSRWSRTIA